MLELLTICILKLSSKLIVQRHCYDSERVPDLEETMGKREGGNFECDESIHFLNCGFMGV